MSSLTRFEDHISKRNALAIKAAPMIINPILVDEKGKRIFTSHDTDKPSTHTIYESEYINVSEVKEQPDNRNPETSINEEFVDETQQKIGPFFLNMVDPFQANRRLMNKLFDRIGNEKYDTIKKDMKIARHVR